VKDNANNRSRRAQATTGARRCGARTRTGEPFRSPAVRDRPRCRMQGCGRGLGGLPVRGTATSSTAGMTVPTWALQQVGRYLGYSGRDAKMVATAALDPMYGPAVRRKRFSSICRFGLASMYPASHWSVCAPGHHGYQRVCVLISGQASNGPFGSPGLAGAGKTDPPYRFHPLADLGRETGLCHRSLLMGQFLCSCREAVPSSRPAGCAGHRAQGPSRLAVAMPLFPLYRLQATS
jgi:hypothetical protein